MNNYKKTLAALLLLTPAIALSSMAQEDKGTKIDQLSVESRVSYDYQGREATPERIENKGFKGKFLNLRIDGQIVKGLTFSYRQRLNKNTDQTFFDATDWLHVDWAATNRLSLSAGKQVVAIGGYEYDRAPIDLYSCSEFWNNIPCYQLGVSATYRLGQKHSLLLQVCNSPFRSWMNNNNSYGINLMWYGNVGRWQTMYSANMLEYAPGDWVKYIALGNRFLIANGLHLDVDLMSRSALDQSALLKDFSIMSELSYSPTKALRCFAKYTYDQNKSGDNADKLILDGTQLQMGSAGVEWSPIDNNYRDALRLYATGSYSWGDNTNPNGTMQDKELKIEAGMKFRLDILEGIQRMIPRR